MKNNKLSNRFLIILLSVIFATITAFAVMVDETSLIAILMDEIEGGRHVSHFACPPIFYPEGDGVPLVLNSVLMTALFDTLIQTICECH